MALFRLFVTISLQIINGDNLNGRDDCFVHSLNNNTCTSSVTFLCLNINPLISLIPPPPESRRILNIHLVVALETSYSISVEKLNETCGYISNLILMFYFLPYEECLFLKLFNVNETECCEHKSNSA